MANVNVGIAHANDETGPFDAVITDSPFPQTINLFNPNEILDSGVLHIKRYLVDRVEATEVEAILFWRDEENEQDDIDATLFVRPPGSNPHQVTGRVVIFSVLSDFDITTRAGSEIAFSDE